MGRTVGKTNSGLVRVSRPKESRGERILLQTNPTGNQKLDGASAYLPQGRPQKNSWLPPRRIPENPQLGKTGKAKEVRDRTMTQRSNVLTRAGGMNHLIPAIDGQEDVGHHLLAAASGLATIGARSLIGTF